jgi:taurine transport system ATP-binding protein
MRFDLPNGGSVQALKDVSLKLPKGELLSVLGPSGCGKTTLLNIVAGFLAPTDGQVVLNHHRVTGPGPERGMVFQQGALFEWMDVRDNVSFGPDMKGRRPAVGRAIVDHLLRRSGCRISRTRRSTSCPAACSSVWRWRAALPTTPTSS